MAGCAVQQCCQVSPCNRLFTCPVLLRYFAQERELDSCKKRMQVLEGESQDLR